MTVVGSLVRLTEPPYEFAGWGAPTVNCLQLLRVVLVRWDVVLQSPVSVPSHHLGEAQGQPIFHQRPLCPTVQPDEDIIWREISLVDLAKLERDVMKQISQQEHELILRGVPFSAQVNQGSVQEIIDLRFGDVLHFRNGLLDLLSVSSTRARSPTGGRPRGYPHAARSAP